MTHYAPTGMNGHRNEQLKITNLYQAIIYIYLSTEMEINIIFYLAGHQNTIWICTCVGLIVGIAVVILDYTLTTSPTLNVSK